ncbi:MAG: BREX system ATP-binding domain-containing protein [Vulcanimicrobiota bacterium]
MSVDLNQLDMKRAIESLRSGVPSSAAVNAVGSGQELLSDRFRELLKRADQKASEEQQCRGMMIRAGFGEGKSHLLTAFEHIALEQSYAVSRLVISKETPLNVPAKLLCSAIENLQVPGAIGRGLDEVGLLLRKRFQSPEYSGLFQHLTQERLDPRFAVTLHIFKDAIHDEEIIDRVLRFWSGEPFGISELKRIMRDLGIADFRLESMKARELALQTFTFIPMMLRAAGLKGWVLLVDELELIGRYGKVARGQSYAELARWFGALEQEQRPGLITVGAITSDFEREVLVDKGDLDSMPLFIEARNVDPSSVLCGMPLIQNAELLVAHDEALLKRAYISLKHLHSRAYKWEAPEVLWPEVLGATPMRTFVRAWINAWDVRRIYNVDADQDGYEISSVNEDYMESSALESVEKDSKNEAE